MDYNEEYRLHPALFGAGPGPLLKQHYDQLDPEVPVLDLGCGQGRHTLFLARLGYRVEALDPSQVAVETVRRVVRAESLPVRLTCGGFESADLVDDTYGGVLAFGLIQILSPEGIRDLAATLGRVTRAGGLLFATAFSTEDPRYAEITDGYEPVGPRTFRTPDGERRTYLEPGEILSVFDGWTVVHHWEGLGPEHQHGDGPPERHARIEVVLRR